MSGAPQVSVIIATRNRWRLLSTHGLPSAFSQEDVDFEVIVVDDGSTDETPARLAELNDPRLHVLRRERPRGPSAARNTGIAAASGEWLAFLDDDDLWSPCKLRAQLDAASADAADWVYGASIVVDERKVVIEAEPFPDPAQIGTLLLTGNFIPGGGSNVIVTSDAVRRADGFDEAVAFFEDWDLWLRLAQQGRPAVCPEVVMARVEHSHNRVLRDRRHVMRAFERLMGKHRQLTRRDRLGIAEWTAHENYRAGLRLQAAGLYLRAAIVYRSPGNLPPTFGALFGEPGMKVASRLLLATRGVSHLEVETRPIPTEPAWLERYR